MIIETLKKYNTYVRILKIPRGTVLSEKQTKTIESGLKNTKIVRKILADYFERKGKSQDERAIAVDMALEARECFLKCKHYLFDKTQIAKRKEEAIRFLEGHNQEMENLRHKQELSFEDWFRPFTI